METEESEQKQNLQRQRDFSNFELLIDDETKKKYGLDGLESYFQTMFDGVFKVGLDAQNPNLAFEFHDSIYSAHRLGFQSWGEWINFKKGKDRAEAWEEALIKEFEERQRSWHNWHNKDPRSFLVDDRNRECLILRMHPQILGELIRCQMKIL